MKENGMNNVKNKADNQKNSEVFASCSFSSLGLHPSLCDELKARLGFEVPTQVQAEAIPVVLSGRHVLVNAATGTGKTVAYLAPIIHHLQNINPRIQRSDGTFDCFSNTAQLIPVRLESAKWILFSQHKNPLCKFRQNSLLLHQNNPIRVYEILVKLLHRFHWIVPGYIMGGENRSKEKARLRKGISILVATPGRLLDHLKNTASFVHTNLRWVIFDEADRILELGFGKDIEQILDILGTKLDKSVGGENASSRTPEVQKQNLLLSATLNEKVNHLAKISLENPVMIGLDEKKMQRNLNHNYAPSVKSDVFDRLGESAKELSASTDEYKLPSQLVQRYIKVPCGSRLVVLLSVLKHLFERDAGQKIVVFFSTCDAVDFHYSLISKFKGPTILQSEVEVQKLFLGCKTLRLHGNMNHEDRKTTFGTFKTEKSALLLSTDVSARGLDFPKVRCIIQYDSPGEATEYVHRVGRTARLGEKGESLLFLQPVEIDYLKDLENHGVMLTEYPLLKLLDSFHSYGLKRPVKKFVAVELHPWMVHLQRALESFVSNESSIRKLAKDAFCSWVRAYTAHRGELKQIFMVKKLHLGHVAKSFALKEQPSVVNKSYQKQMKKRKRDEKHRVHSKKKRVAKS